LRIFFFADIARLTDEAKGGKSESEKEFFLKLLLGNDLWRNKIRLRNKMRLESLGFTAQKPTDCEDTEVSCSRSLLPL
jgi:hypothetical protein